MVLQSFVETGLIFSILTLYVVCWSHWTGDKPIVSLLPTHRTTQTQNIHSQASMHLVGFEPTTPVFEWAVTVHAFLVDRPATAIAPEPIQAYQMMGNSRFTTCKVISFQNSIHFISKVHMKFQDC
jgi:hypothetical protein